MAEPITDEVCCVDLAVWGYSLCCAVWCRAFRVKEHKNKTVRQRNNTSDHSGPPRWPSGKASASRAEDPGFESRLRLIFSGSSHTSDLKIGTPVATLPGAWSYRVSAGTGRPGVSIL